MSAPNLRGRCRFCGRGGTAGQHRVPGPRGPICADCVVTGLRLTLARGVGTEALAADGVRVYRMGRADPEPCEFCARREHRNLVGLRRPLRRMTSPGIGSVICADCLDRSGDLLNQAIRH